MKRNKIVKTANDIISHTDVVNTYNKINPLPQGYILKDSDDWCAGFVSVVFAKNNYIKFAECSVPRMITLAKKYGIYKERDYKPLKGDVIIYDWDDVKDGDHVGIITNVNGGLLMVREGNVKGGFCNRAIYTDDSRITGYIAPKYEDVTDETKPTYKSIDDIVDGIIRGDFGNGDNRKENIFLYFQNLVNQKMRG